MRFSEQIIKEAHKYLKIQLKKKFLVQIADGTLEQLHKKWELGQAAQLAQ